ncbi:hypothetical protein ANN_09750 [Periplaneta americana]|uniref:Uncharacterized protein n=1 Tax=Periplaneta americana TaxID=6978 RepID=A0ABQ8TNX1_PERAM|nr:hypothetical protein ANN_09750 [Periplaneta americana]
MWIWRRMERVKWTDRIRNEAVLERVGEERMMLKLIRKRKRNWLGHLLRKNCLLKDALEGMANGTRVRACLVIQNISMGPSLSRHKMVRRHVLCEIFRSKGGVISLWGIIKQHVSKHRYQTIEDLKQAVREAFREITPPFLRKISHRTWRRIILCRDNDGPILMFRITKQAGT